MKLVLDEKEERYKIVLYFYDENDILVDLDNYLVMMHFFNIIHLINFIISKNIKPKQMKYIQESPSFALKENKVVSFDQGRKLNLFY